MISRVRALIFGVIAAGIGWLSYALGVGSVLGQRAEASVLDASAFTEHPPAPLSLVSPLSIALALGLLALIAWISHGFGRALSLIVFGGGAVLAAQFLKQELLQRPGLFELDAPNTFPSGHMTIFAVLAGGLIWAVPAGWRGVAALGGAVLMGTVSWQLLEFGWHRPSDVIGAQALAVLAFAAAAVLRLPHGSRLIRTPSSLANALNLVANVTLVLAGLVLLIGGAAVALFAAVRENDALMLSASDTLLIGASAWCARACVALAR